MIFTKRRTSLFLSILLIGGQNFYLLANAYNMPAGLNLGAHTFTEHHFNGSASNQNISAGIQSQAGTHLFHHHHEVVNGALNHNNSNFSHTSVNHTSVNRTWSPNSLINGSNQAGLGSGQMGHFHHNFNYLDFPSHSLAIKNSQYSPRDVWSQNNLSLKSVPSGSTSQGFLSFHATNNKGAEIGYLSPSSLHANKSLSEESGSSAVLANVSSGGNQPITLGVTSTGTLLGDAAISNAFGLNLSSTKPEIVANFNTTIIVGGHSGLNDNIVGGTQMVIHSGSLLTAAQYAAAQQVLTSGQQTLIVGNNGSARGGLLTLVQSQTGSLSSLVISRNVTVDAVGYTSSNPLNISGASKIFGTLDVLQMAANPGSTVDFGSLSVGRSGSVTDILSSNLGGQNNLFSSSSLTLSVINNVANQGSINTIGNLNINSGGAISNQGPQASITGASVNLTSGNGTFNNSGLIKANIGNVSFDAPGTKDITVNNAGGTVQASQGSIAFRDPSYSGNSNITLNGGNYLSQKMNLNSGTGSVNVNVDNVTGVVSTIAGSEHFSADTANLIIGNSAISGDPTYYNTGGAVTIAGNLIFSGQDLAIVANTNIVTATGAGAIDTSSTSGNGGNITMIAGVNFNSTGGSSGSGDTTSTLSNFAASSAGGYIDLSGTVSGSNAAITSLTSASSNSGNNGGNINLVAFGGTGASAGTITLPNALIVYSGGAGGGGNGNVTMIAGANTNTAITVGSINTSGGTGGGGNISLYSATPTIVGNPTITNGTLGGGSFTNGSITGGGISTAGTLTTATGATAAIIGGGSVSLGGAISTGAGGTITIAATGSSSAITSNADYGLQADNLNLVQGGGASSVTVNQSFDTGPVTITGMGVHNLISATSTNAAPASLVVSSGTSVAAGSDLSIGSGGLTLASTLATASGNSVVFNGNNLNTNGGSVTFISGNNVMIPSYNGLNIISSGGAINVIAGANYSVSFSGATPVFNISGGTTAGGQVYISGIPPFGTANLILNSSNTQSTQVNGGNINVVAFAGTGTNSGLVMSQGYISTSSGGSQGGTSGNQLVIAGASTGTSNFNTLTSTTSGTGGNGGSIDIYAATPILTSVSITNGTLSGTILPGSVQSAGITTGGITGATGNAGVIILSNGGVTTGGIQTGSGGITVASSSGGLIINGLNITDTGGSVVLLSGADINFTNSNGMTITAAGEQINLLAGASYTTTLSGLIPTFSVSGGSTNGGQIYISGVPGFGTANLILNSSNTQFTQVNGGNINVVAFAGTESNSGLVMSQGYISTASGGSEGGTSGNLLVFAGANTGTSNFNTLTSTPSQGSGGTGGSIDIYAATPILTAVSITNGALSGTILPGSVQSAGITTGAIATATGNAGVTIVSNGAISTGGISAGSGGITVASASGGLVINGQNITDTGGSIVLLSGNTINFTNSGGMTIGAAGEQINLLAGANYTTTFSGLIPTFNVSGGSSSGGQIYISGVPGFGTANLILNSSNSQFTQVNGGNINVVAFAGTQSDSGLVMSQGYISTASGGSEGGTSGNLLVIAGANSGTSNFNTLTSTPSQGSGGNGGSVDIYAATPVLTAVSITNGALSGTILPGVVQSAAITTGAITGATGNAGVIIVSNGVITTGGIQTGSGGIAVASAIGGLVINGLNITDTGGSVTLLSGTDINFTNSSGMVIGAAGEQINLLAGANYGTTFSGLIPTFNVSGGGTVGGKIYISGVPGFGTANLTLNTSNTTFTQVNGGDTNVVAFAGTETNSGIVMSQGYMTTTSGGSNAGTSGNLLVIAGANSGTSNFNTLTSTNSGTTGNGGSVDIYAATPILTSVSITNGVLSGTILPGAAQGGGISTGAVATATGNAGVTIVTNGAISTGGISAGSGGITVASASGGLLINGLNISDTGGSIVLLSGSDINFTNSNGMAIAAGGQQINLLAGANYTTTYSGLIPTFNLSGGSTTGGQVYISAVPGFGTANLSLNSSNTTFTQVNGGDINVVAFAGTGTNSGLVMSQGYITTSTGGSNGGTSGNLLVIAGANAGTSNFNTLTSTNSGATGNGGNVDIYAATPVLTSVSITNGVLSGAVTPGAVQSSGISVGGITGDIGNAGVIMVSNGAITTGNIQTGTGGIAVASGLNTSGSSGLTINGQNMSVYGGSITFISGTSINFTNSGGMSIAAGSEPINLLAGANFTTSFNGLIPTFSLIGGTAVGGRIYNSNGTPNLTIYSWDPGQGTPANGGNVNIVAFAGTDASSGLVMPSGVGTVTINSGGSLSGLNGNVLIIAGAASGTSNIASINSSGATGSGGNIDIYAATPSLSTASITNGIVSGTILPGAIQAGGISTGGITGATGNADVIMVSNGVISTGGIQGGSGGTVLASGLNTSGSSGLIINGQNVSEYGGSITFISGTSINFTNSGGMSMAAGGEPINLLAGANFTTSFNGLIPTFSLIGGTTVGGHIYNSNGTPNLTLYSWDPGQSSAANGGNVNIVAFAGTDASSGLVMPNGVGTVTINSGGSLSGSNGNVLIIAGAASGTSNMASINSSGATGSGGNVSIYAATPSLSAVSITNGIVSGTISAGQLQAGNLVTGSITTNGNGTTTTITGAGNAFVNGNITAQGVGSAPGGIVDINTNSATVFTIGSASAPNGVNGTINVSGDTFNTGGSGGTINVVANGTGGITLNNDSSVSFTGAGGGGSGGNLTLNAVAGPLTIASGTLNGNGNGNGPYNGGNILLTGTSFTVTGGTATIVANGSGTGNGGSVTIITTGAGQGITFGGSSGAIASISATGGSTNSAAGNGGSITLNAAGTLTIPSGTTFSVNALGTNGNGGSISLTGSIINVTGGALNLTANGVGTGVGGNIFIQSTSNNDLNLGTATGDIGALSATGISGGYITVISGGNLIVGGSASLAVTSGGITLAASTGSINIGNGSAFNIITAGAAVALVSNAGIIMSSNPSEITTDGGAINMIAGAAFTNVGSTLTISGASGSGGSINLSGLSTFSSATSSSSGNHNGGGINLAAFGGSISMPSNVSVTSGGIGSGINGLVNIIAGATSGTSINIGAVNSTGATGGGGSITIVTAIPVLSVGGLVITNASITSGSIGFGSVQNASLSTGALTSPGQTITVTAGGTISTAALTANGVGTNGSAGNILITAPTIQISQSVSADGVGSGNGGNITITYNDSSHQFVVGASGANSFINGNVVADAIGAGGLGGTVNFNNQALAALNITLTGNISANATTSANLGAINFLPANSNYAINVAGAGNLIGIVNASGSSVNINPQALNTTLTTGQINSTAGSVSLIVDPSTGTIIVPVTSSVTSSPNGTDVTLNGHMLQSAGTITSARDLIVEADNISITDTASATRDLNVGVSTAGSTLSLVPSTGLVLTSGRNINLGYGIASAINVTGLGLNANNGAGLITLNGGANNVTINATSIRGTIEGAGAGNLAGNNVGVTTGSGNLTLGSITSAGSLSAVDNDTAGIITIPSGAVVTSLPGGTDVTIDGHVLNSSGTMSAARDLTLIADTISISGASTATRDLNLGTFTAGAPLSITSGNGLVLTSGRNINLGYGTASPITVTGVAINAANGAGDVTFNGGTNAVNVNVPSVNGFIGVTGSSVFFQSQTGNLNFNQPVNTSSVSGSGGSVSVTALGGAVNLDNVNSSGVGATNAAGAVTVSASNGITFGTINANGTSGASGGAVTLTSIGQSISGTSISTSGSSGGGSVSVNSADLLLSGVDGSGNSINASSTVSGNGGGVSITLTDPTNNFVMGSVTGTNGTAGNIISNAVNTGGHIIIVTNSGQTVNSMVTSDGANGGRIDMWSGAGVNVNDLVTANGTTGNGGMIEFAYTVPGASAITVTNDGTIQANSNANTTGVVAFNGGAYNAVTATGTGTINAGQYAGFGDINSNTLAVFSPLIISTTNNFNFQPYVPIPPSNDHTLAPYILSQSANVNNQIIITAFPQIVPPTPPSPPSPVTPVNPSTPTNLIVINIPSTDQEGTILGQTVLPTDQNKNFLLPNLLNSYLQPSEILCGSYLSLNDPTKNKAWIMSSNYYQPFNYGGDSGSALFAKPGTVFKPDGEYNIVLKEGKLTAITGEHAVNVQTQKGQIMIPAHSTVIVEQTAKNVVRVDNLDGANTNLATNKKLSSPVSAAKGEELVIADDSLSQEELIPVDGVPRGPIAGGKIVEAGLSVTKSTYDSAKLAQSNYWLFMMLPCVNRPVKARLLDLQQKMTVPVLLKSDSLSGSESINESISLNTQSTSELLSSQKDLLEISTLDNYITKNESLSAQEHLYQLAINEMPCSFIALPILPIESNPSPSRRYLCLVSKNANVHYTVGTHVAAEGEDVIGLENGEVVVYANGNTTVKCGRYIVHLKAGTIAWLTKQDTATRVCSLAAQSSNSIEISYSGKSLHASYGQEIILGDKQVYLSMRDDNVARRNISVTDISEKESVAKSEISIVSVFGSSDLMALLYVSHDKQDKIILDKILKTAASINVVTGSKGPYNTLNDDQPKNCQGKPIDALKSP